MARRSTYLALLLTLSSLLVFGAYAAPAAFAEGEGTTETPIVTPPTEPSPEPGGGTTGGEPTSGGSTGGGTTGGGTTGGGTTGGGSPPVSTPVQPVTEAVKESVRGPSTQSTPAPTAEAGGGQTASPAASTTPTTTPTTTTATHVRAHSHSASGHPSTGATGTHNNSAVDGGGPSSKSHGASSSNPGTEAASPGTAATDAGHSASHAGQVFYQSLPTGSLSGVGARLAEDVGIVPKHGGPAQKQGLAKVGKALGIALIGSSVVAERPPAKPASQPLGVVPSAPFAPAGGGERTVYLLAFWALVLGLVLFLLVQVLATLSGKSVLRWGSDRVRDLQTVKPSGFAEDLRYGLERRVNSGVRLARRLSTRAGASLSSLRSLF